MLVRAIPLLIALPGLWELYLYLLGAIAGSVYAPEIIMQHVGTWAMPVVLWNMALGFLWTTRR